MSKRQLFLFLFFLRFFRWLTRRSKTAFSIRMRIRLYKGNLSVICRLGKSQNEMIIFFTILTLEKEAYHVQKAGVTSGLNTS